MNWTRAALGGAAAFLLFCGLLYVTDSASLWLSLLVGLIACGIYATLFGYKAKEEGQ